MLEYIGKRTCPSVCVSPECNRRRSPSVYTFGSCLDGAYCPSSFKDIAHDAHATKEVEWKCSRCCNACLHDVACPSAFCIFLFTFRSLFFLPSAAGIYVYEHMVIFGTIAIQMCMFWAECCVFFLFILKYLVIRDFSFVLLCLKWNLWRKYCALCRFL